MTLVFEGTPSSGGPRCLRSLWTCVLAFFVPSAPFSAVSASFVVSVKGITWPGTFVGALAAGSAAAGVSAVPSSLLG